MFKNKVYNMLLLVGVVIASLHYMFFVAQIQQHQDCFASYNKSVLASIQATKVLLKDSYDNQNKLTVLYAAATAETIIDGKPISREEQNNRVDLVFAQHNERIQVLNARFEALVKETPVLKCD